ncbi:hypothetical protein BO78DRAFT_320362, partial [Aspergillus sclerotiicarbonarius CBS 121057]
VIPFHRCFLEPRSLLDIASQVLETHPLSIIHLVAPFKLCFHKQRSDLGHLPHFLRPPFQVKLLPFGEYRAQVSCMPGPTWAKPDGHVLLHPGKDVLPGRHQLLVNTSCMVRSFVGSVVPQRASRPPTVQVHVHPELEVADAPADSGWEGAEELVTLPGRPIQPYFVSLE